MTQKRLRSAVALIRTWFKEKQEHLSNQEKKELCVTQRRCSQIKLPPINPWMRKLAITSTDLSLSAKMVGPSQHAFKVDYTKDTEDKWSTLSLPVQEKADRLHHKTFIEAPLREHVLAVSVLERLSQHLPDSSHERKYSISPITELGKDSNAGWPLQRKEERQFQVDRVIRYLS